MPVDTQNVPISFEQGIDTKTDPKQLVPGKMLYLRNASFVSVKNIQKRDGFAPLTQNILGGGTVSKGVGIASYKDELISLNGTNIYSYSPDKPAQVARGQYVPLQFNIKNVIRNTYAQNNPDMAYDPITGYQAFVYFDSQSGGANYSIIDSTTGTVIVNGAALNATTPSPGATVHCIGSYFVFIYPEGAGTTNLKYKVVDTATPNVISTATNIATDLYIAGSGPLGQNHRFCSTVINGKIYVVYKKTTTDLVFVNITSSLVLSSPYVLAVAVNVGGALTIFSDTSYNVWCGFVSNSNLYGAVVNEQLNSTVLAATLVYNNVNPAGNVVWNLTGIVYGTTATFYYETQNAILFAVIYSVTLTITGTAGSNTLFLMNQALASRAFKYNNTTYLLTLFENGLQAGDFQPTYFIVDGSKTTIGKLAPRLSGPKYVSGLLPQIVNRSIDVLSIVYLQQDFLTTIASSIYYKSGVSTADINFAPSAPSKLEFGNNLHISGAQLWMYDGANCVEHGFHLSPIIPQLPTLGYQGGIGAGTSSATTLEVQYCAIYEWQDNQGQIHQSAPSSPIVVTLPPSSLLTPVTFTGDTTAGSNIIINVSALTDLFVGQVITGTGLPTGTYIKAFLTATQIQISTLATATNATVSISTKDVTKATIQVTTLSNTLKPYVSIVLYRTAVNGTVFYRASSVTSLTYNDKTLATVTFTDTTPDPVLIGNAQLYTTGGEVANVNLPAVTQIAAFKNRAVAICPEYSSAWFYSKQILPNVPVEFSSLVFYENIDQRIIEVKAIKALDDKIILFGPNKKFLVVGTGPSPSGANNDFIAAQPITGTTGCINFASILETPIGLIYQDPVKGIWLLDRSLAESYIGSSVEQFKNETITSSALIAGTNRAIFTLASGTNLIYDYYVNQWSTDLYSVAAIDSATFEKKFAYLQANGLILKNTPAQFSDNGSVIPLSLKTGWLYVAGIEGFQRVKEFQLIGEYKSPHTLTINFYYNYSATIGQTVTIPVTTNPGLYQFRVHLAIQKCESIQIEIIETPDSTGEGLSISAMGFRVGVKAGLYKLPAGASY